MEGACEQSTAIQVNPRRDLGRTARPAAMVGAVCVLALGSIVALVALALVALIAIASTRPARGVALRAVRWRARRARETARLRLVRRSGAMHEYQYEGLRELVRGCDEEHARRFDLEGLLGRYAATAAVHRQHLDALDLAPGFLLPSSKRAREIRARRMRQGELCTARVRQLEDELESIAELVMLIAQQLAMPAPGPGDDGEVDRRLSELDELDRANGELSAVIAS